MVNTISNRSAHTQCKYKAKKKREELAKQNKLNWTFFDMRLKVRAFLSSDYVQKYLPTEIAEYILELYTKDAYHVSGVAKVLKSELRYFNKQTDLLHVQ